MRRRIRELKEKLETIQVRRRLTRQRRPWPLVCLVGYTNAGKSTLLNAFAAANAYVDDRLFATLDVKTRLIHLPDGRKVLLTDTVGFIRHLPHGLVASFRSTLEEASESNLLLIVADLSHPRVEDQLGVVKETLKEIGADAVPSRLLFNKCDAPGAQEAWGKLSALHPDAIPISALRRDGIDRLKDEMARSISAAGRVSGRRWTAPVGEARESAEPADESPDTSAPV
jgi:GTP-binding protein HflX